jgi:hypothetical protein
VIVAISSLSSAVCALAAIWIAWMSIKSAL